MPSLVITAIQSLTDDIRFDGTEFFDMVNMDKMQKAFFMLKDKVLMEFKSQDKNKTQLRMVFNDFDRDLNGKIRAKTELSEA